MGGYGSGRKFGADCTEDFRSIDIRRWQRDGHIVLGRYFDVEWKRNGEKIAAISVKIENEQIRLTYFYQKYGGEWENLDYPVRLQTTACHYGGIRYWFTCPAANCGRRIVKLYSGGKIFACRHCYKLAYKSQRETPGDRAIRKADKLRDKLNWDPGILNSCGWKPKGMHWKTYYRLTTIYDDYANQAMLGISEKLGIVENRLSVLRQ